MKTRETKTEAELLTVTRKRVEAFIAEINTSYGVKLTLGYLGNCNDQYDDRTWYIWVDDLRDGLAGTVPSVWSCEAKTMTHRDWMAAYGDLRGFWVGLRAAAAVAAKAAKG